MAWHGRLNEQRTVTEKLILVKKTIVGISEAVERQALYGGPR
jgi:hypothetical protein